MKRKLRNDQHQWVNDCSPRTEEAARIGDSKQLYNITGKLSERGFQKRKPIKSKNMTPFNTQTDQLNRWERHFTEVLITECLNMEEPQFQMLLLKMPAFNESPPIPAEILKVDTHALADTVEPFFRRIWQGEKLPTEWKIGIIVKIPKKKGGTSKCINWRGITLLPALSKILN